MEKVMQEPASLRAVSKTRRSNLRCLDCFVATLLAMTMAVVLAASAHAAEPVIGRVALSQKAIDLAKNERAAIEFQLSEKAFVDLEIYDESNELVLKRAAEKVFKKGKRKLEWDGRNQAGEQVSSGVYVYVLEARGVKPYRFDPREKTGGEEIFVEKLSWNVPKKEIKYVLPRASYVRTRIGLKDGILMGTLEDWTPLAAGEKTVLWGGRDPEDFFDLSNHPDAQINISAFSLPDNAIIVKSARAAKQSQGVILSAAKNLRDPSAQRSSTLAVSPQDDKSIYIHARHPRSLCHEPRFQVEFPNVKIGTVPVSQGTVPIFGPGKIPVRITLDPGDKDYLTANRFEIMFFVDSVFLFEQEEATSPFTIELDSKRIGAGEHLLTINVMDYEDHVGTKTLKIKVPAEESLRV